MLTESTTYIKEIKNEIKKVNAALKAIQELEAANLKVRRKDEYNKNNSDRKNNCIDIMQSVEEIVRLASTLQNIAGVTEWHICHKVTEYSIKSENNEKEAE